MSTRQPEILVGVGGGIAAYKSAELVSRLVKRNLSVTVVMTATAHHFIGRATFEALSNRPVFSDLFDPKENFLGEHIGLARRADLIVLAPATADLIAKVAHGMADDLLTTTLMAAACPVMVAPTMNTEMWNKPSFQRNLKQIQKDGLLLIEPDEGWLSCRISGKGRMAEPEQIEVAILKQLGPVA